MSFSPLNSTQTLTSGDLFNMIGKIYADSKQPAQAGQDKQSAAQALANQKKIEDDVFFNQLIGLFKENQQVESLKQALQNLIQERQAHDQEQPFNQNAVNQVENQYGQSPLSYAFQNQDFNLAKILMDFGAQVGPLEKESFEIALDSEAAKDVGFHDLIQKKSGHHPAKKFGQVLGIKTISQDGTSSQFDHIEPTYQIMTDSVGSYAAKNPSNQDMKAISDAFKFSNKTAAFANSTPQGIPKAGVEIANRIQSGKTTTIPINCKGHAMGLSVVPDGPDSKSGYLVYTNRGVGSKPGESGTQIYQIDDLSKISPELINDAMSGHSKGASYDKQMARLNEVTGGKAPIHTISQKRQKGDNCPIANSRANIHGTLLCQKAVAKGGFDNLVQKDFVDTKDNYKKFTHDMRQSHVNELASKLSKNPNDPDTRQFAKDYLTQHPNADASLREPLEKGLEAKKPEDEFKSSMHMKPL